MKLYVALNPKFQGYPLTLSQHSVPCSRGAHLRVSYIRPSSYERDSGETSATQDTLIFAFSFNPQESKIISISLFFTTHSSDARPFTHAPSRHCSDARPLAYASSRLDTKASKATQDTVTFHKGASIAQPPQGQQVFPSYHCVYNINSNSATARQHTAVRDRSRKPQALEGTSKL